MVRRNKYSEKVMTPGKQKYKKKNSYLELHRLHLKNIFMHKSKTSIWGQYLLHKLASKKLIVNNI